MDQLFHPLHRLAKWSGLLSLMVFCFSCDIIPQENRLIPVEIPLPVKKVLLEEFTGMKCPNCPDAANTIDSLRKTWGDNIVPVSIHSGIYAKPSGIFTTDFRTEAGSAYEAEFGIDAFPAGLVDRTLYNNKLKLISCEWNGAVMQQIIRTSPLGIDILNQWTAGERKLAIKVQIPVFEDVGDALRLQIWLVEDSIMAPQMKGTEVVYNYVHRHVFRGALNGTWGEDLKGVAKNAILEKTIEYQLPGEFNPGHCEVVAFIYRVKDKSVVQVNARGLRD